MDGLRAAVTLTLDLNEISGGLFIGICNLNTDHQLNQTIKSCNKVQKHKSQTLIITMLFTIWTYIKTATVMVFLRVNIMAINIDIYETIYYIKFCTLVDRPTTCQTASRVTGFIAFRFCTDVAIGLMVKDPPDPIAHLGGHACFSHHLGSLVLKASFAYRVNCLPRSADSRILTVVIFMENYNFDAFI